MSDSAVAQRGLQILKNKFGKRLELRAVLTDLDEKADAEGRDFTDEEKATIVETRSALDELDKGIASDLEIETRSAQIGNGIESMFGALLDQSTGDVLDTRSAGERFVQADGYKEWAAAPNGSFRVELDGMDIRAVTDATTGSTSAGAFINNVRLDRVGQDFLDRRTYLMDLLPHIPVSTNAVEYVQDQSPLADMANKAVEVTEGGAKPQAGVTLALITEPMATIAAWANITRQAAEDIPQIQGYLDNRLRYSLKRRADGQIISGNGTLPNISGLTDRSGILTYAPGGAEARYKSIRHAIRLMEDAEAVPEIIVLNPADAELFDLANEASAGLHAIPDGGGMANASPRTAWGLRQVRSTAVASGTAVLLDPMAVAVFDRQAPTAYMTDSHASNFTSNILTLLLELRIGLGVFDPDGILALTFNGTT